MYLVGKIDTYIYKCVTNDIVTDEVIITDERIDHIVQRRGQGFYDRYGKYFKEIIENPEYKNSIITAVGESSKRFKQRLRNNIPLYKKE